MMQRSNVLPRRPRPTAKAYLAAVKTIVLRVQALHNLNDSELADRIGCSESTVRNARKELNRLDGVTLANIEHEFGTGAIDPYLALAGARSVPEGAHCDTDANPALEISQALTAIIGTQRPESEAGAETTGAEAAEILPELRDARRVLDALILRGERHVREMMGESA